jgi:hypothetical protein
MVTARPRVKREDRGREPDSGFRLEDLKKTLVNVVV